MPQVDRLCPLSVNREEQVSLCIHMGVAMCGSSKEGGWVSQIRV